ncbi:hillarin-like [Mizuhopecten yessoensis]|uniref:Kyphoscoliosis peptidase n=1 Tax=Mizuhopecten yessoensis TaxID=6573 RepID=A0A210QZ63_MIZYE|nr:hillarin-like [Mizuhopecten yessoensis]OWF54034.1 Kyphoscoliosis peptidase [Mizuhopecten yessoensis]
MGCGASLSKTTDTATQPIDREQQEAARKADDKPSFTSETQMEVEYIGEDELKIMKTLRHYPKPVPNSKGQKQETPVQWFNDWTPEWPDAVHSMTKQRQPKSQDTDSGLEDVANIGLTVKDIEFRARHTPRYFNESFDDLLEYLVMGVDASARPDMLVVRALVNWLSSQKLNTYKHLEGTEDSPEGCLALLAQKRTTFSTVFTIICRKADIPCVQIGGMCKALGRYQPGDTNMTDLACLWNAVYIEMQWYIIHPIWMCRTYVGTKSNGWFKFAEKSQLLSNFNKQAFTDYYMMTDPEEFKNMCYPFDSQWQLQKKPMSRKEFLDQPYLLPPFFGLGLALKSKHPCVLDVNTGKALIEVEAKAKNSYLLHLWYELSFGNSIPLLNESDGKYVEPQVMPKHVRMVRSGYKWKFDIHLPVEGAYKFAVFAGPNPNPLVRVCEFLLKCSSRKSNCLPLRIDPGPTGFGPNISCELVGLVIPMKTRGEIYIRKGDVFIAKFLVEGNVAEKIEVKATFYASGFAGSRTEKVLCEISRKQREVSITATVPKDGEYILTIWTASNFEQRKRNGYQPVCHYLLTSYATAVQESPRQRHQRRKLQSAMETEDMNGMGNAIELCIKEGIDPNDDELEYAKLKCQVIKARKDVHDCSLRKNLDITVQTLKFINQSRLTKVLCQEIVTLNNLKEGQDYGHVDPDYVETETESEYSLQYSMEPRKHLTLQ